MKEKNNIFMFPKTVIICFMIMSLAAAAQAQIRTNGQNIDEEWQLMIERINLLVDNHFQNRDFDEGQKANWNITGLSVGIYKNGRTAFFNRGFHESQQRNVARRRPVTENSIFAIGSISKPISNIMLSYFSRINNPRTGRPYVNLNDSINKYFKTKPFIDTNRTQVYPTLMQLATHYGGISRETGGGTFTLAQFRSLLENLTYVHKPGAEYLYSSGSVLAANAVASVVYNDFPQRRLNDLLLENLFTPLGMNSTKLAGWLDPAMQDRMTLPHNFNGTTIGFGRAATGIDLGGASGNITSTTVDMMRLAAFILGDSVPQGSEIVQQAAAAGIGWGTGNRSVPGTALSVHESNVSTIGGRFREMFTRPTNSGQRYGRMLAHGGAIGGHQAYMIMCPDTKTAVVVLVNTRSGRGSLAEQIMDSVLNATYSSRRTPFNDFDDRVASYSGANANVDIVLTEDLTIEAAMNNIRAPSRAGATLTIRSANPARPVTLTRGVSGLLFTVPNGATLIFRDIIIDGGGNIVFTDDDEYDEYDEDGNPVAKPPAAVIEELVRISTGGTLIMEDGAVLRNNSVNSAGGVGVRGTFNMRGGLISGNTAASDAGGVHIYGGTFNMSGGEISGNTAGRNGGGIGVFNGGAFTMTGGKINGNTNNAGPGGGVYVGRGCTFIMNNGEISGNTAVTNNSGGVRIDGAFTMNGGKISGNTAAANYGGGMSILSGGNVTMNGGEISGNNATLAGGVLVWTGAAFTMNGGIISGNTAPRGSGLRINGGVCNLNGGAVAGTGSNLTAVTDGTYNLNTAAPRNAVIIAWNRPSGALNYTVGTNTNLTVSAGGTATWANQGGALSSEAGLSSGAGLGISYTNGTNRGWIKAW